MPQWKRQTMKISWIIPVFNSGEFLSDAINSITANEIEGVDAEIILIDDCSTDEKTVQLLGSLRNITGIEIIFQGKNGGPAKARNAGIRNATGEWIAFLDSDDLIVPGSLALRINAIKNHPEIRWLAGDMLELIAPEKSIHLQNFERATVDGIAFSTDLYKIQNAIKKLVLWGMLPYLGSMMIRRDLIEQSGHINEDLVYGEDAHFCLVLSRFSDLHWINIPCLVLRRYHDSMTKDLIRAAKESPRALQACLGDPRLKEIKRELRWRYSADLRLSSGVFLKHGMRLAAIRSALKAVACSPNDKRSLFVLYKSLVSTNSKNQ